MSYGTSISRFLTPIPSAASRLLGKPEGVVTMAKIAIYTPATRAIAARILREIAEQARE